MRDFAMHRHLWRYRLRDWSLDIIKGTLVVLFFYVAVRAAMTLGGVLLLLNGGFNG